MSADKEMRKAFEATQIKNMKALLETWKIQRKEYDELKDRFQFTMNEFQSMKKEFADVKKQVAHLLQLAYAGGSTPEDVEEGNGNLN